MLPIPLRSSWRVSRSWVCSGVDYIPAVGRLSTVLSAVISQALVQRGHGSGRVPVLEVLIRNRAVQNAILSHDFESLPEIMERNHALGMQTVDRGLKDLLNRNVITKEEALYRAVNRDRIHQRS